MGYFVFIIAIYSLVLTSIGNVNEARNRLRINIYENVVAVWGRCGE